MGKVLQGFGGEEKNEGDAGGGDDLGDLALAAGGFDDCSLGGASVDDEGTAESSGGVGCGKADDVLVFVEALVVARGVDAGGCRALSQDHHGAGSGD